MTYRGVREDGSLWERVKRWFGYKVHLIVDVVYELPLGYKVTRASVSDTPMLLPMMEDLDKRRPWVVQRAQDTAGDKAYDSAQNNREFYDRWGIKPVMDIRRDWKDGEQTRPVYGDRVDNIVMDERGSVYCVRGDETIAMAFCGFESKRGTLKYRCPVPAATCCATSSPPSTRSPKTLTAQMARRGRWWT